MRKLWIIGAAILFTLLEAGSGWSWPVYDHRRLAFRARLCISLPLPIQERCKTPVDLNLLYNALATGAVEPDESVRNGGDGLNSPKHSYNPVYPTETKDWDPSIKEVLDKPNAQINAGLALNAIRDETENVKGFLRNLTCESKLNEYEKLYKAFGRLSHYPADLAGPLHAYSVGVDNRYHEGDMGADGIWFKGLWDYPKAGMLAHGQLEYFTGIGANFDKLACSLKSPTNVAIRAREKMKNYESKHGPKAGYEGLIFDFLIETGNPMGEFTAAVPFFKSIGQVQAQDALAGILDSWQDALKGFVPLSDCDKDPDGECESSTGGRPGGDHPDDTFNVSTQSLSSAQIELLEQAWNRLAVKKNKKSLIWHRMQEYLLEQYYFGNVDEESYHRLSQGYEMTPDVASELYYEDYITTPDVAILGRGFALSMSDLLQNKFNEPVRRLNPNDLSPDVLKDYPLLIVPSGGFLGIEHSDIFKASLDGYVKDGGTLIVFAQQHGYEFSALPAPREPDGTFRTIGGYGWSEDQSCFVRAAYIETWHPMLSGQINSTPTLHLDGYFTIYPSNATVLLRRTSNGQPALLMYDYGEGRVIVTSMYSDFALKQNQASAEEIALVRDMISWAKRPGELPGIRPGEIASVDLDARNGTTMDAASIRLLIFTPDRSILLSEKTLNHTIMGGHSVSIPFTYTTNQSSPLGIYHVDYILFDAEGKVIQPQAETDSGRFAVSRPPRSPYKEAQVNFSIHSDAEVYTWGSPITFTIIVFNDSDMDKSITAKYEGISQTIHVPAKGSNHMTYSRAASLKMPHYSEWWDFLRVAFYEGNTHLSSSNKNIKVYYPVVDVRVQMDKRYYGRGETGTIGVSLKNNIPTGCPYAVYLHVLQGSSSVFRDTKNVFLTPNGVLSLSMDFVLPPDSPPGTYTAIVGAMYEDTHIKGTGVGFHVLQSQIELIPAVPETYFNNMTIPFILNNTGKVNVSQGILGVSLKDPDWEMIHSADLSFALSPGESKTLDVLAPVPGLKFGNYTLIYSQSDETRTGNPTKISIPNSVNLSLSFDRPSYRIRETANLKVDLRNTGKFNLENLSVTVSAAGANYSDVKTISLGTNLNTITLNFGIPIPETLLPGAHHVEVAVRLSSGSQLAEMASLFVPESTLNISYPGVSDMKRGDPISIDITNTGGSDTTLTYTAALTDHGVNVSQHSGEDTLQAGQTKTYVLQVPFQAMDGPYILFVESLDQKTQRRTYFGKNLTVSGLKAELIVETDKDIYLSSENIIVSSRIVNQAYAIENGHLHLQIVNRCDWGMPTSYHLFTWDGAAWVSRGILHYPNVLETRLIDLSPYLPDPSGEYKVRIKHAGEDHAAIDYIGLVADSIVYTPISALNLNTNNDILAPLREGEGWSAFVLNNEIEVQWTGLSASNNLLLMRAQEGEAEYSPCQERIYWEIVVPLTLTPDTTVDLSHIANPIHESGQFYLQGKVLSQTGQMLSRGEYRFNVIHGDLGLRFHTDKAIYREGEPIQITGDVVNLGWIEETKITVRIYDNNGINISTDPFDIPAKGSYPISFTTTAGSRGIYQLYGVLYQNGSWLASVSEKYEVAILNLSATADAPSIVGDWEFPISITFDNDGKIPATVQVSATGGSLSDARTITIGPNERKLIQYIQSISSDTTYVITITGDLVETISKTVTYGLGASFRFGDGSSELGVFSEGHIAIPITITNTGEFMETVEVSFELNPGSIKQSKIYSLPKEGSATDTLYFVLTGGDYLITASSQKPYASAQANLSVRKESQVEMAVSFGIQADGLIPVHIGLTNLGSNEIDGSVNISASHSTGSGQAAWYGKEILSPLPPQAFQLITLHINPSTLDPGNYTLEVKLLNNSHQLIAIRSGEFEVQGANFLITQLPPYQTFTAGQEATFLFKVKNTGDREGTIELRFKAYDLIDSTQREWLKAGEEKAVSFRLMAPDDLEERDYAASYELKDAGMQEVVISKGEIKYRLAGINLKVSANLNEHYYNEGDTARLAVRIESNHAAGQSLFARVNYDGYESQQSFMLNQTQTIYFDIPLTRITGEKLFYGVYHESGRSNHLNSIYIHKAGEILTVTTDKQVYQPGETIEVSITGNASGMMTLSGPGGYEATFDFSNQVTKVVILPLDMVAGTYFIHLQLLTPDAELITALHPFDVAGIQVKVLECKNDRGKYASSDTIATTLIISSNATMPAVLRTWVVDPAGKYTSAGEQSISLSSSQNSPATYHSSFGTALSGLHRLVYGIYSGDILLVSGSEAFDVGDAVLLGLSTDRKDYPEGTEPVLVKVSLFGSVNGDLVLELDGNTVKSESVSLDGFEIRIAEIQGITPGYHTLRAILTAGGLPSVRETSFTYAMHLIPKPRIATTPAYMDFGSIILGSSSTQTFSVSNTGNVVLEIHTITLSGTNQEEFGLQNDRCSGKVIPPDTTCTVDIHFIPASPGTKSASVSIPSNAASTPDLTLPLSGTGITTLKITIAPENGGSVMGAGIDCPEDCTEAFSTPGATIVLHAIPAEGYQFYSWSGDINELGNPVTVGMGAYKNITANFITHPLPPTHTIDATASAGGSLFPSGRVHVGHGENRTFSIIPNPCYQIADVLVDWISEGAINTYTFENVTAAHTIHAIFKPSLLITKTITDVKNILVWLNFPWSSGKNSPERVQVEKALQEAGVGYEIVLDKKDFAAELRNPSYTDIVILGDHHPMEDHFSEELREQVYSGKGIISSLFHRQNLNGDVFGIKFIGHIPEGDYPIEVLYSEALDQAIFHSSGKMIRIEALRSDEIIGWITEVKKRTTRKYPGIIQRKYGEGKVLFFAFDLGLSARTGSAFEDLFRGSLNYIHPPRETAELFPGQFAPVEIEFKSRGEHLSLSVTETCPPGVEIFDPTTGKWIRENPWRTQIDLVPDMSDKIFFYALTPDKSGSHPLQTGVECLKDGKYHFYRDLVKEIIIEKDAGTMLFDILSALSELRVSGRERAKVNNAIGYLNRILSRTVVNERDIEKTIDELLKAINSLLELTSVDISLIRLKMDALLRMWEGRWYFFE